MIYQKPVKIGAHIGIGSRVVDPSLVSRYGGQDCQPECKGFCRVPQEAVEEVGGNAFQIFNHNPRFWKVNKPTEEEAQRFIRNMEVYSILPENCLVHSSYLVNIAGPKEDVYEKSILMLEQEIEICEQLHLPFLNIHPGSHLGNGEEYGIQRIGNALNRVFISTAASVTVSTVARTSQTCILLESVSPKGGAIGFKPVQMRYILDQVHPDFRHRIGYCYDTCHGFDAGYDITKPEGVQQLITEIREQLGWDRLKMIHLNDSKFPLGAHQDRHANIGEGTIGMDGFKVFFSFPDWADIPCLLETPGDNAEHREDIDRIRSILHEIDPTQGWEWRT